MKRVAVLVSGNGSNLQALIQHLNTPQSPARVSLVVSNVPSAYALTRAQRAGIPAFCIPHKTGPEKQNYERALVQLLQEHQTDFVCLAGFMRLLSPLFLGAFPQRVLNVHPSLLPSFPGMHAPQQALRAGVKLAGCTVHLLDEGVDSGPILAQSAVQVLPTDDVQALTARIQQAEHLLYPLVVRLFAQERLQYVNNAFFLDGWPT